MCIRSTTDGAKQAPSRFENLAGPIARYRPTDRRRRSSAPHWSLYIFAVVLLHVTLLDAPGLVSAQSSCAAEGKKARRCGANGGNKPNKCCDGLKCREDGTNSRCVPKSSTSTEPEDTGSTTTRTGNKATCAMFGGSAVSCGEEDITKSHACCPGYKCQAGSGSGKCTNASKKTAPLDPIDPILQVRSIPVNEQITVRGTEFETAHDSGSVRIRVPGNAKKGDLLLMLIGGSASGNRRPEEPLPSHGWEKPFLDYGKNDLNLMALYKWYNGGDDDDDSSSYTVSGGKNTLVILTAITGLDRDDPIVDSVAERNTLGGKDGRARTPPNVRGEKCGATMAVILFDDPQVVQVIDDDNEVRDDFHVLVTSTSDQGADGMAAFIVPTEENGNIDRIAVAGSVQKGGGNDIAAAITLRASQGGGCSS